MLYKCIKEKKIDSLLYIIKYINTKYFNECWKKYNFKNLNFL